MKEEDNAMELKVFESTHLSLKSKTKSAGMKGDASEDFMIGSDKDLENLGVNSLSTDLDVIPCSQDVKRCRPGGREKELSLKKKLEAAKVAPHTDVYDAETLVESVMEVHEESTQTYLVPSVAALDLQGTTAKEKPEDQHQSSIQEQQGSHPMPQQENQNIVKEPTTVGIEETNDKCLKFTEEIARPWHSICTLDTQLGGPGGGADGNMDGKHGEELGRGTEREIGKENQDEGTAEKEKEDPMVMEENTLSKKRRITNPHSLSHSGGTLISGNLADNSSSSLYNRVGPSSLGSNLFSLELPLQARMGATSAAEETLRLLQRPSAKRMLAPVTASSDQTNRAPRLVQTAMLCVSGALSPDGLNSDQSTIERDESHVEAMVTSSSSGQASEPLYSADNLPQAQAKQEETLTVWPSLIWSPPSSADTPFVKGPTDSKGHEKQPKTVSHTCSKSAKHMAADSSQSEGNHDIRSSSYLVARNVQPENESERFIVVPLVSSKSSSGQLSDFMGTNVTLRPASGKEKRVGEAGKSSTGSVSSVGGGVVSPQTLPTSLFENSQGPLPTKNIFLGLMFLLTHTDKCPETLAWEMSWLKQDLPANTSACDSNEDRLAAAEVRTFPFDKHHLQRQIEAGSGVVLDRLNPSQVSSGKKQLFLISDTYQRTVKYFQCLAAGVPIVSHQCVIDSSKQDKLLDYKSYLLPAGISFEKCKIVERSTSANCLISHRILLTSSKPDYLEVWNSVLELSRCKILSNFPSTASKYRPCVDVVVTDETCIPSILKKAKQFGVPVVGSEWVIQCLINNQVMNHTAHERYAHDLYKNEVCT